MLSLTERIMKGAVWHRAAALRGAWMPDGAEELWEGYLSMQNGFKHPPEKEDFKRISSIRIIARDSYIYIFGTHPDIAHTAVLTFAPHLDFCELQQLNVSHYFHT